jgi:hypothetical protein
MPGKTAAISFVLVALIAASPGVAAPAGKPGTPAPLKNATSSGPLLFHGYACGGDCSIHQSGYRWAADHAIANPAQCQGISESFIEGCRAFAGIDGPLGEREIFQDDD